MEINRNQRRRAVMKLRKALGSLNEKTIGVLGLAFKPNTDDIRESPAMEIIHLLQNEGAHIKAYDPQAMPNASKVLSQIKLCETPYEVADEADALLLATHWNEFTQLDFSRIYKMMRHPVLMDGRNLWDAEILRALGFKYFGVGRAVNGTLHEEEE
jgi:UDPglucose 6-dehydrogenase